MEIEVDVQKRILRSLQENGGSGDTIELARLTDISPAKAAKALFHLVNRGLVIKTGKFNNGKVGRSRNSFKLNDTNPLIVEKINRLILEIEE